VSIPREHLEALTEALIAAQDVLDGDHDREADDPASETVPVIDDPDLPPTEDDGDPDLEETGAEDSFMTHPADGPGCPVADQGGGALEDSGELTSIEGWQGCGSAPGQNDDDEYTYPEWQTLPATQRRSGNFAGKALDHLFGSGHADDVEEDDADTCVSAED
jgi:hypothetical protein